MSGDSSSSDDRLDAESLRIVEAFEAAWETGRPDVRACHEQHPGRPLRLLLELAAIDLENRSRRGEVVGAAEYLERFPQLAADASCGRELRRVAGRAAARMSGAAAAFPYLAPATEPGAIGELAHYRVIRVLGQGAFGTVFEAFDGKLHRRVAIKVLSPELATTSPPRKRFIREARAMAAVSHENIVRVHAVEEEPIPYLVMEYVDGGTLQERMEAAGPFPATEAVHVARQVAAALAAAHERGLIHRDVKPANVLLESGAAQGVKLTDFGLARAADDASMTRTGTVVGTPVYMSPEQAIGGTVDHRSDLFSLGSLLYALVTGRPAFRAPTSIAVLKRVVDDTPRPIAEIIPETPPWLVQLISRLLEKKPEDRIQSAREVEEIFADAQRLGIGHQPRALAAEGAKSPAAAARIGRPTWRRFAALAVAAGLAAAAWSGWRWIAPQPGLPTVHRPMPADGDASAGGVAADPSTVPRPAAESLPEETLSPAIAPFDAIQARKHQEAWAKHLGIPVETTNSIGQTLVVIPPGRFTMGEGETTVDVTLTKPFLLGQTEVTQGQWKEVMGTSPWKGQEYTIEGTDVAATFVSWDDAVAFCEKLTTRERDSGLMNREHAYRLPTEAEWEFACRAGTVTRFPFGDDESLFGDHAWSGGGFDPDRRLPIPGGNTAGEMYAHAVGLKQPNPFGLYDMLGNVWEWCADWSGDYSTTPVVDPTGPSGSPSRVLRGSCWAERISRSAGRGRGFGADGYRGWRVAVSATEAGSREAGR